MRSANLDAQLPSRMPCPEIAIDGRLIGSNHPVYIIAELSANHGGRLETAIELIHAAKRGGADAIKLQTYTPDTMTLDCDCPEFRIGPGTQWAGQTLFELYRRAQMPWDWQPRLMNVAADLGMHCFSTPFDESAVDFLESLGVPAYKVASFELVDLPLLQRIGRTGQPVIASTGMASLDEIRQAVQTLRAAGTRQLALLKCTSAYPAPPASMHLRTIHDLMEQFDVPAGLSDHTLGIAVPVCAVGLGATIIEKHITLDRRDNGPDSAFSLEPAEFQEMVRAVRTAEAALGTVAYGGHQAEEACRPFRRSLFVVQNVAAGEVLTRSNVRSIRPGHGLSPKHLPDVLGRRASCDLVRGTPLEWQHISPMPADVLAQGRLPLANSPSGYSTSAAASESPRH
jgi:N-acetylneuraminate synthase